MLLWHRRGDGQTTVQRENIRLNGEWLPQSIIISSALMLPKQTLPVSLLSSLQPQGAAGHLPQPRPIRSLSHKNHPVQGFTSLSVGEGALGVKGVENPWQRLWGPSLSHLHLNSGGGSREVQPPPTSWAGGEETLLGTGGQRMDAQGEVDLCLGPAVPQPARKTTYNMGCTGPHLFLSHSTGRAVGTREGGYVRSKAPVSSLTNGFPATGGLVLSHVPLKQQSEQESSQAPHTGVLPGAPQCMTCEAPICTNTH